MLGFWPTEDFFCFFGLVFLLVFCFFKTVKIHQLLLVFIFSVMLYKVLSYVIVIYSSIFSFWFNFYNSHANLIPKYFNLKFQKCTQIEHSLVNSHIPITQLQVINSCLILFHLYPYQLPTPIILKQISDISLYISLKDRKFYLKDLCV